jgi:TM2 domain-containing membrane protein YozV
MGDAPPWLAGNSTTLQDSVVTGDVTTSTVVHHHYNISATPPLLGEAATQVERLGAPPSQEVAPASDSPAAPLAQSSLSTSTRLTYGDTKTLPWAYGFWLVGGLIGFHRFYLGQTSMGLLYLFTGGLLGLGWLIDAFNMTQLVNRANGHTIAGPR